MGEAPVDEPTPPDGTRPPTPAPMEETGPVTLAEGEFGSLEHPSNGAALLVELPDGSRYLRLEDLETSNGPDLRVILTDRSLFEDRHVWDEGGRSIP